MTDKSDILNKAWTDDAFMDRLEKDPRAALAETGLPSWYPEQVLKEGNRRQGRRTEHSGIKYASLFRRGRGLGPGATGRGTGACLVYVGSFDRSGVTICPQVITRRLRNTALFRTNRADDNQFIDVTGYFR